MIAFDEHSERCMLLLFSVRSTTLMLNDVTDPGLTIPTEQARRTKRSS